jgi:hypothetical protein
MEHDLCADGFIGSRKQQSNFPDHAEDAGSTDGSGSCSLRWTRFCWLSCWPDTGTFYSAFDNRSWRGRCGRRRSDCGRYRRSWRRRGRSDFGLRPHEGIWLRRTANCILLGRSRSAKHNRLFGTANGGLRNSRIAEGDHAKENGRYRCCAFHRRFLSGGGGNRRWLLGAILQRLTMACTKCHFHREARREKRGMP